MKLESKKKETAEKMGGKCSICGRAHDKSMHSKKGKESLNPPHRGRDNEVMSGKNEKELS